MKQIFHVKDYFTQTSSYSEYRIQFRLSYFARHNAETNRREKLCYYLMGICH